MNIVILGPGAVGSLWANAFLHAGHSVSLCSRQSAKQLSIQVDQGNAALFANNDKQSIQDADLLLVTVKAPQVITALTPLLPQISPDCMLMLMHNGMGTAEDVIKFLPNNPLLLATTTHGAYRESSQRVLHTGLGTTQLGGYNDKGKQCAFLEEVFQHALPEVKWNHDILHALWHKLAINCAINPLTAIHQVTNGTLAQEEFSLLLSRVIDEVSQILAAEEITLSKKELEDSIFKVIELTAKNHSSMQQDVFHHRATEIDFITGYLLHKAKHHNIAATENTALYQQIKQIEQSWNHE